ncbi:PASTA domain-containing protein [Fulvivirgaceae bacterium BMA10]|uniref:PASTA domain-containing protein n=1 Tax=Splendidivirga corallicola TaxID=3051826 RepID=A0ABT8KSS0_9BACT|nr:PASTA domain-containing protein [Fulvivirgaceae bacterium BMA10]
MIKKPNSVKDVAIHLVAVLALGVGLIMLFFYVYLPNATSKDETVTVPNLTGFHIDDIDNHLTDRNLIFEVTADSGYSADQAPLTVLQQYPKALSKVKEQRKIYITLNAEKPPKVRMPKLVEGSLKSAQIQLKALGLEIGKREYVPHWAFGLVLKQSYNGNEIEEGELIYKGSKIDLVIGDSNSKIDFPAPDVIGQIYDEAVFEIEGYNLKVGVVLEETEEVEEDLPPGTITRQTPGSDEHVRSGDVIDLWVKDYEEYLKTRSDSAQASNLTANEL